MHFSYEIKLGHIADFRVKYRFYTQEEGRRVSLPYQGLRCDFWYDHGDNSENQIFMVWPEFENAAGEVILENDRVVPQMGTARMWVIKKCRQRIHGNSHFVSFRGIGST